MINLDSVLKFASDVESVVDLAGNCGRKVRRVLDCHFKDGVARFILVSQHQHLLQFAYNLEQMDRAVEMAANSLETFECEPISFEIERFDKATGEIVLLVSPKTIPESVKARQTFLSNTLFALYRVQARTELKRVPDTVHGFLDALFGEDGRVLSDEVVANYLGQFDKLLSSDFSEIEDASPYLVTLAERLNPEITQELARIEDEYNKTMDLAFADFAKPKEAAMENLISSFAAMLD